MHGVNVYCVILSPSHSMAHGRPTFQNSCHKKTFFKESGLEFFDVRLNLCHDLIHVSKIVIIPVRYLSRAVLRLTTRANEGHLL